MSWITPEDVTNVFPAADLTVGQITHIQGLAEGCIGPQTEPVSDAVKSVMVEIAYRFWRGVESSTLHPEGYQSEQTPEYGYEHPTGGPILSGFGITDRECAALKHAAGYTGLGVQRISRGPVETPSHTNQTVEDEFDVV